MGQKGRLADPVPPFHQGFTHQLELGRIRFFDSEFQVAHTAVQQLRAAGAGAHRWIFGLQQGDLEPAAHSLIGQGSATGATANDQQISAGHRHATPNSDERRCSSASASVLAQPG